MGYEDGTVRVWDLKQGNAVYVIKGECGGFTLLSPLHFCYLDDLWFMICLKYDWENARLCHEWFVCSIGQDGHQGALTTLACNKDGSLVLTGSVDGCAKLIKPRARWVSEWGKKRWRRGFVCRINSSVKLLISVFMCCLCLKVVGSFSVDGGKAKASKDDEETNSVESVGFCNTWVN